MHEHAVESGRYTTRHLEKLDGIVVQSCIMPMLLSITKYNLEVPMVLAYTCTGFDRVVL